MFSQDLRKEKLRRVSVAGQAITEAPQGESESSSRSRMLFVEDPKGESNENVSQWQALGSEDPKGESRRGVS
jgi:hypothetical protein